MYIFLAASAGQTPILVVVHPKDSASKRAAQFMSAGFREAVNKSDKYSFAPQSSLYGDREIDTGKLQKDAETLATAAQTDYDNLETDKAQQKFEQALAIYENNAGEIDSMKPAAKYALLAAAAALLNNNDKVARTYMQRALLYDPNAQADPRIYNPAAMGMFKEARAKMSRGQKGSLSVSTNPAYAEMYVDGEFYGMTPDKIDRLDAGPHLVRVVRDGFRSLSEVIDVKAGRNETAATLNMVAMPQQQQVSGLLDKATADLRGATSAPASTVAAKAGVNYVVLCSVSVNGDQVKAQAAIYHASNQRVAFIERTFSASMDTYKEEASTMWDGLQKEASKVGPIAGKIDGNAGTTTIRNKSNTKWIVTGTLLGVGGALLITGGVFGGLALSDSNALKQLEQLDPTVPDRAQGVKTKALVADIGLIGGAAVAVAGVLCLLLWDDRPKSTKITEGPKGLLDSIALDVALTQNGGYLGAYGHF